MINRICFKLLLFIFFLYIDCFSFSHINASTDSCLGEIKFERIDTVIINPALPYYRLHFVSRSGCYSCDVYLGNQIDTIQHIVEDGVDSPWNDDEIQIVDANYDGFLDILILFNRGNTTNEDYEFWLFNPKSGRFEFNREYTDKLMCNPSIGSKTKEITTGGTTGCIGMCVDNKTYRVIRDELVLVSHYKQELIQSSPDTKDPVFERTLEKLENGQMKVIHRVSGTLKHIDALWNKYWDLK